MFKMSNQGFLIGDLEDWVILDGIDDLVCPEKDILKFCVDIFIRSMSGLEDQEWVNLEDVECS